MAKTNKYALVTGGSRGIGREICLKLGGCGYHVLVNYKSNAAEAEKTLSGIRAAGGDGEALQFDVASGEESTAAIEAWQKAHEGACIEVVVNNAGIRDDVLMMWMEPQQWHSVIGTSLDGFYNVTRPLLKGMLVNRFGRIVNIVSLSGIKGLPGQANYAAAKGGVIAATKALAQEVARKGVTVNARNKAIKDCYDVALTTDPKTSGTVVVKFKVEKKTGKLIDVGIDPARNQAPEALSDCIVKAIDGLTLEPVDQRQGDATFTWSFKANPPKQL